MEKYGDSIFADRLEQVYEAVISGNDLLPHARKLLKLSHDAYDSLGLCPTNIPKGGLERFER